MKTIIPPTVPIAEYIPADDVDDVVVTTAFVKIEIAMLQ